MCTGLLGLATGHGAALAAPAAADTGAAASTAVTAPSATPVAAASAAGATPDAAPPAPPPTPSGNFFSSLKQAFAQDIDREVVRGHFDVGTAPDTHRYYCLINAKTGQPEKNGVAGEPVERPDGMTGIRNGAVAFYSCADAEAQGILVTSGYMLSATLRSAAAAHALPAPRVSAPFTGPAAATTAGSPVTAPGQIAPPSSTSTSTSTTSVSPVPPSASSSLAVLAAPSTPGALDAELMALFTRFISGYNAPDRSTLSDALLDSDKLVLVQGDRQPIWGHAATVEALAANRQAHSRWDPAPAPPRIAQLADDIAVLVTSMRMTPSPQGHDASTAAGWSGVFVKTAAGWRIASIFITCR